ncbi:hypothetical protein [Roseivirga misakiensis]|uniref:Prolyl 4-hydroxylase alpha subunit Fe(2+) 2OG dioxygenase domain-containing protein n=1 Tax=Roseivirga misakiensis TaxID=1563681 RepID=A0A1E5T1I3_9BACT|nr:hypothetical protein [Roseivirga misakiensis]OEK05230.1 hypothetical protein BFP71_17665 [Roseivirga misakiensis]
MNYSDLIIPANDLIQIRKKLYHSEGPGYYVFQDFIDPAFTSHIISFWSQELKSPAKGWKKVKKINKDKDLYMGCPNYLKEEVHGLTYFNYLWNEPLDEVTYAVSWKIMELRNQVMSRNFYLRVFPTNGNGNRSNSFRVVLTKNGEEIVKPHKDWTGEKFFDPAALQATLILSDHDTDYSGEGLMFKKNNNEEICLNRDIGVKKGDLILWKYTNEHCVRNVNSSPNQLGFVRILFPPEQLFEVPDSVLLKKLSAKSLTRELARRAKRKVIK